ncbi:UDP-N-acetylmuramoyl-tripeptide--D-alanyl-D-alanine ligase [Paenibacillus endoradicis]|uniref:UDP-N-acetylmuramoyl-tripeptide--D-alanyl-D- alanine ligase n=1 Tax=Paenibacillus endoradicis TaxID=2972487 RepID=UPI00280B7E85|nr:UDP-N-acetylmuramoyl-tripeptide--D-alanyl-D-alanine ligase [Paenibacillus endoradicis]
MTLITRTVAQLAEMSGAILKSDNTELVVQGVMTDSRTVGGQLFVPLVGEHSDGHQHIYHAVEKGATAALWKKGVPVPEDLPHIPFLLVRDPLAALQKLAMNYRSELFTRVVAITGSNGKTTTKDMTAALLSTVYKVSKTQGNFNNHIGLPLTILALEEDTDIVVVELGMSGFGEIELLTQIAQPDVAIITNIGDAHMLQLGSRNGIAQAKLEIVHGLGDEGVFIYNGDEPLIEEEMNKLHIVSSLEKKRFGLGASNDWSAANIELDPFGSRFEVLYMGESCNVGQQHITTPGRHNVSNALAAIAVARLFGVAANLIQEGFNRLQLTGMRIAPTKAHNGAIVLNDAYNANPTATRAAIDLLGSVTGFRKKWLVLSDMLELGPDEIAMHVDMGQYATSDKVDAIITYGNLAAHIVEGAKDHFSEEQLQYFTTKEELIDWLLPHISPDDLVLVKGSRSMKMEQVVEALEKG